MDLPATTHGVDPEAEFAGRMPDSGAYKCWATPHPMYLPWEDVATLSAADFDDVRALSLNEPARLYYVGALARYACRLSGAFAECGVFRGGSALLIARATSLARPELHLIDSFEGLSQPDSDRDVFYQKGDFNFGDIESVRALLAEAGGRVSVYKGWIPDILGSLPERHWAFVHLDLDLYAPTLGALNYFYSRMEAGGVFLLDEYGFATCRGERDAVDTFFEQKPERPIVLPTGQAFVIKAHGSFGKVECEQR